MSCVTRDVLGYSGGIHPSHGVHKLCFPGDGFARLNQTRLSLFFSQHYRIVPFIERGNNWRVHTSAYYYRLDDETDAEILSYHWHPENEEDRDPHLHLKKGAMIGREELQRAHLPTGRVAIERVILFVIREFGVRPMRPDWEEILLTNVDLFERYRTWA
jgi:hypothetical protein